MLEKGDIIPINFDYVFTSIFNNQENIEILEAFLSDYLEYSVKGNLKVLPRDLKRESKNSRGKQVDLILNNNGNILNIELNNSFTKNLVERNIVYACNIHGGQLKYKDNTYRNIKSTLQINLNASNTLKTDRIVEEYSLYDKENDNILTEKLKIDIVNLQNFDKKCYTKREEKLAKWSKIFLATEKEKLLSIGGELMEKEVSEKLVEEVKRCSEDREFVELYSMYSKEELERNTILEDEKEEAREKGLKEGIKEGIKEGRKEGIKEGKDRTIQDLQKLFIEKGIDEKIVKEIINDYKEKE